MHDWKLCLQRGPSEWQNKGISTVNLGFNHFYLDHPLLIVCSRVQTNVRRKTQNAHTYQHVCIHKRMLSYIMTLAKKKHELTPYMFGSSSERGNGLLTTAQTVTSHKPFRARVLACWATFAEKPPSELIALLLQWSMAQTGARKLWCDRTRRKKMVFFSTQEQVGFVHEWA